MFNPTGSSGASADQGCTTPLETRTISNRPTTLIATLLSASGAERFTG